MSGRKKRAIYQCIIAFWVAVWFWLFVVGCTPTSLTVAPVPVAAHVIAPSGNNFNAGVIDCDKNGCLVDENWMEHYRQLEKKFSQPIAEDKIIVRDGAYYRITYSIYNHYVEMRNAERGP